MRRTSWHAIRFIGFCLSGSLWEPKEGEGECRFLQGISHVEGLSARTAKQFPAVPSGNTTVERVRLLGPRANKRAEPQDYSRVRNGKYDRMPRRSPPRLVGGADIGEIRRSWHPVPPRQRLT